MININEYLLGKTNNKSSVSYPELGCDLETIADWIESYGIEKREEKVENWNKHNWYYDQLTYRVYKERPGVQLEYRTGVDYYNIILDPTPGNKNTTVIQWSDDVERWEDVSFNAALKIADKVLTNKDDLKKVADIISNYKKYLRK